MKKILVTGGFGFIGSYFVEQCFDKGYEVFIVDNLTYATQYNINHKNIEENIFSKYGFETSSQLAIIDISDKGALYTVLNHVRPDTIVNFAAESHVDRSLENDATFIKSNVTGVKNFLDYMRENPDHIKRFVQVSTDEVGGEWPEGSFVETDKRKPRNPYSATKGMAELLCEAYSQNFDLPVIITRGSNTYGPRQYPEKLIPLFILNLLKDAKTPIYDGGTQIRDWLHAHDHAAGIMHVLEHGKLREIYHIGGEDEKKNIEVINKLYEILEKPESLKDWNASRLGHDSRYSLNCDKLKSIGWRQQKTFEDEIKNTVKYYVDNANRY